MRGEMNPIENMVGELNPVEHMEGEIIPRGLDGISPEVEVTQIDGGYHVKITDKTGIQEFDLMNGTDGRDGIDGRDGVDGKNARVEALVHPIEGGYTITITDESGTMEFDLMHGKDGAPGESPNLQIGTVTTLEPGSEATASITGQSPNLSLNLGIPRGGNGESDGDGDDTAFVGDGNTTVAEYYEAFSAGKVCFMKRGGAGGAIRTWVLDNCNQAYAFFYHIDTYNGTVEYGKLDSDGVWTSEKVEASNVFIGDKSTTVAEFYEAFSSGKVCFLKTPVAGGVRTWVADNCGVDKAKFYNINSHPSSGTIHYGTLDSRGIWTVQVLGSTDVDLTGYATEEWVQKGYQPKGNYLTKVPDGYAKTDDIPTKPGDIGAQPAGNYALVSEIPNVPVQSVNGKTGAVNLSASDVGARPNTWMPSAQDVGALPSTYTPPNQTAAQVGADPVGTADGKVSSHNTNTDAHNDIRLLITALTTRLDALANSDDDTLDQMAEVVAYIKANRDLIDQITTGKVSASDIVNNLITNVTNKPLSAAQGVALKALIDAITVPTKLSQLAEDSTHRVVTDTEKAAWNAKSTFSGKYEDLSGKPTIPTVPTKVSAFTNDAGYLTGYTETDPTVPSWAKAASKPSYSKSEVGLGNVDNVKQYSASNPPPYPVTSVNGKTGVVTLSASDVNARPNTWTPSGTDIKQALGYTPLSSDKTITITGKDTDGNDRVFIVVGWGGGADEPTEF
jgi:hypothetical protein